MVSRIYVTAIERFPTTRYQGSKRKLLDWIRKSISHLAFDSALDLFSGTASVSYLFKVQGKTVTSNDSLAFNQMIAQALICNSDTTLQDAIIDSVLATPDLATEGFIEATYKGIFFTDDENRWLDNVASRIHGMPQTSEMERNRRALAYFALYQSCLAKRPYNLFHRANLSMRTARVTRQFGNKTTWEKPFPVHFQSAIAEANQAIFSNGRTHKALCRPFDDVPGTFDLVYMDPPYLNSKGVGVDYLDFYHFLEGLTDYARWPRMVTSKFKHKPFERIVTPWSRKETIGKAFDAAIDRYRDSILVISYRSDGIPSVHDLIGILERHGRTCSVVTKDDYKYVLCNRVGGEVLLISERAFEPTRA